LSSKDFSTKHDADSVVPAVLWNRGRVVAMHGNPDGDDDDDVDVEKQTKNKDASACQNPTSIKMVLV
jgi:hypothetical protein